MTAEGARPPLDPGVLREGLVGPELFWRQLEVVDETGSTNADLTGRAASGGDVAGTVLLAEHQTGGRGRGGRTWSDVPKALIVMSVGISVDGIPAEGWGWVPLATGVAVVDAVRAVTGIRAGLKLPNDVVVGEGKLAGILAEVAAPPPTVVVGIGLNVTLRPEEIAEPAATSLLALGAQADRNELVRGLLRELQTRIGGWRDAGGADQALMADYRSRSTTIGSRVRATLPGDRDIVGLAVSVDEQGRLVVDTGAGTVAVSAGDVVHLRPLAGPSSG
jgi:BirA family transcriptional regulator, biotin operon repressor / biotin---[acetyl-CoA-carboxylase] ligase